MNSFKKLAFALTKLKLIPDILLFVISHIVCLHVFLPQPLAVAEREHPSTIELFAHPCRVFLPVQMLWLPVKDVPP